MPKLEFRSNAKPSQYAYPPPLEDKKEKTKEKVLTAVLSITAKQKKKEAEKKKDEEKMDVVGQNKVKDIIYRSRFRRKKDEEKMDVVIKKMVNKVKIIILRGDRRRRHSRKDKVIISRSNFTELRANRSRLSRI